MSAEEKRKVVFFLQQETDDGEYPVFVSQDFLDSNPGIEAVELSNKDIHTFIMFAKAPRGMRWRLLYVESKETITTSFEDAMEQAAKAAARSVKEAEERKAKAEERKKKKAAKELEKKKQLLEDLKKELEGKKD